MSTQFGLFSDGSDTVLAAFLQGRKKLLIWCGAFIAITSFVLFYISGEWQNLILLIYGIVFWSDYLRLRKRIRTGRFGEHEMDYELLGQFFAARGIRIENMHLG